MAKFEVDTESGTRYFIDTDNKVMRRMPRATVHSGDPVVFVSDLNGDYEDQRYAALWPLEIGKPLMATWNDNGRPQFRMSTVITAMREIDVPSAQDQPA